MKTDRRGFVRRALGATSAALLGQGVGGRPGEARAGETSLLLPPPDLSGIDHIVVVMMENRSFDHLLGWLPNADGKQAGLTYLDSRGAAHATHALAPDFTGCGHPDPDHSYLGGRVQYHDGAMDGFLRSGSNDEYSIGYYLEEDRPFFGALARHYTTLDRSFCSILGPTFPNRLFLHAAQTDRLSNTFVVATMPTIWDRLLAAGVSSRYYFSNIPFLALWGTKYLQLGIARSYLASLADAASGSLPAVSFVDPPFTVLDDGTGADDHPHADLRRGDAFLALTFHAVANGPAWPRTAFIVTNDEWGGFFDHVAPPRAVAPNRVDPDLVLGRARLGFRVPTVVASPFSRGEAENPRVSHQRFDHTSILKLIEWRFGLPPLTAPDALPGVGNLPPVLQFGHPCVEVPDLPRPPAPPPAPCPGGLAPPSSTAASFAESDNCWAGLRDSGRLEGWDLEP